MRESIARAARGVHWYLKQASGEAKWDEYVEHCRRHQHEPMTRRQFERQRADVKDAAPVSRCC